MLTREGVPLHDEVPVFAELAAIRVSNAKVEPWQDDLYMPAIARPESRQPPELPSRRLHRWHGAGEELAQKTLQGSADMRLWIIQESTECPTGQSQADGTDVVLNAEVKKQRVKAFLCHKHILSLASPLLRYEVRRAEAERSRDCRPLFEARSRAETRTPGKSPRRFQQQKLRVSRPSLLEFTLSVHEEPATFAEILALLYGTPLKVTDIDLKKHCAKRWWPTLALARELQLPTIEAALRRILMDLPNQMSLDVTWALLPLVHAHGLREEMQHCAQVLARRGGKCRLATLPIVQSLEVDALTQVLMSDAWIVSLEAELVAVLGSWLKAQAWSNWKSEKATKIVAPVEVFAASAKWQIRWGHLHAQWVERLILSGVIPESLASDIDRWRSAAGVSLPPLPSSLDERASSKGQASQALAEPRRGRKDRKRATKNSEELKHEEQTLQTAAERAVSNAIRTILSVKVSAGSSVPISPETTEWRTQSVQLRTESPKDKFLQGMTLLCDRVDATFGLEHMTREPREKETKDGLKEPKADDTDEVKAAKRLAGKLIAHIPPNCPWMSRRRCFHTELSLPTHPWQYFSKVVCNDRMTLHCRGQPPSAAEQAAMGRRRSSGVFFEGNRLFELQRAQSTSSCASDTAQERTDSFQEAVPTWSSSSSSEGETGDAHPEYSQFARLTSGNQISAGRHEFLFRVLVRRPQQKNAKPLLAKGVVSSFADAFRISVGMYAVQNEDGQPVVSFSREKIQGTLLEVGEMKPEQMIAAIGEDLPEWPAGGFFDCVLLVTLEPHVKEMRFAVDAAFTQPYGVEAEEVVDVHDVVPAEKPKVPMAAAHFIHRGFLKRWRFTDFLEQDLKTGIALASMLRGAGANPLFLPTFHLDTEALCALGGEGGSATVEVLPAAALRPSWWIDLMGGTVDLPRPHGDSDPVVTVVSGL